MSTEMSTAGLSKLIEDSIPSSLAQQPPKKRNRIHLNPHQSSVLIHVLDTDAFPSKERRERLAQELGMDARSIQIWFQNQRQKVRKSARMERERIKAAANVISPVMMCWQPARMCPPPAPPASPSLSYAGADVSPQLNALVDAAVEELASKFNGTAARQSLPSAPVAAKARTPDMSLLRVIPQSLFKSPKFRPRQTKSTNSSPRLKTLQPRSQPNAMNKDAQM